MKKKLLSTLLTLAMVLSLVPFSALAADSAVEVGTADELTAALAGKENSIKLKNSITLSSQLKVSSNTAIDLAGQTLDMGNSYVYIDSNSEVAITGTGTITSSSATASIVVKRGSTLTVNNATIENTNKTDGRGIMLSSTPAGSATRVALNGAAVNAYDSGVYVHGNLQDAPAPVITLTNAQITADGAEGAGLYLAGKANTTVTDTTISGKIGIGIKAGTLKLGTNTKVVGTGAYNPLPPANGNGINIDGSALLIEKHSSYAGNVEITIDDAALTSQHGHAIREFTGAGTAGTNPKITIIGGNLAGAAGKDTIKIDDSNPDSNLGSIWSGAVTAQTIIPRSTGIEDGVEADYAKAYQTAGLVLGPQAADGSYTLTVDKAKLEAVAAAGGTSDTGSELYKAYKILENESNPKQLWFGMEYKSTAAGVHKALVDFGDGKGFVSVPLDTEGGTGFYNYVKVHDGTKIVSQGETATIKWLDAKDAVLAVTKATVLVRVQGQQEYTITFDANGGTVSPSSATTVNGMLPSLPTPTRESYTFTGWFTSAAGGTKIELSTPFTADGTIYAQWTEKTPDTPVYKVTFDSQGGSAVAAQEIAGGSTVTEPSNPTRSGYTFGGWYKESGCTNKWDFTTAVTENITLYAKWTQNSTAVDEYRVRISSGIRNGDIYGSGWYEEGETVTLTVDPDTGYQLDWIEAEDSRGRTVHLSRSGSRYTFTMPYYDVTIDAEFVRQTVFYPSSQIIPSAPEVFMPTLQLAIPQQRAATVFSDVPWDSWAYQAAQWAYQNGYLNTYADGSFRLNGTVSHQQMWEIMAQWMGNPITGDREILTWALQHGAARGDRPESAMTRGEMIVYLHKCYFLMGGDTSAEGTLSNYADSRLIPAVSARKAWIWAVDRGLISGTEDGYLNPNTPVSRGEFASILMRLCQK